MYKEKKEHGTHKVNILPSTIIAYRVSTTDNKTLPSFIDGSLDDIQEGFYVYVTSLQDPKKESTIDATAMSYTLYPYNYSYEY